MIQQTLLLIFLYLALFKQKNQLGATNQQIKQTIDLKQSSDEEDDSDIIALLNKSSSFIVKQEKPNRIPSDKPINNLNSKINETKNNLFNTDIEFDLNQIQENNKNNLVPKITKITKEEEELYQEQEDYLKKKVKKPLTSNINPVLMKFQNKQIISTNQNQQKNAVIQTKIECESENSQKTQKLQESQKMIENNKITQQPMEIEDTISSLNQFENNKPKGINESQIQQEQNGLKTNSQKIDQLSNNQQSINKTQGILNHQEISNKNPLNLNKMNILKPNDLSNVQTQKNKSLLNNYIEIEEKYLSDDDDDEEEDFEVLKSITVLSQKVQLTNQNNIQQSNKKLTQEQYSILPKLSSLDESSIQNHQEEQNNDTNKSKSNNIPKKDKNLISKNMIEQDNTTTNNNFETNSSQNNLSQNLTIQNKNQILSQQSNRNQVDLSMFDAIIETNNDLSEDDLIEQQILKGTQNDISMHIQINDQNDDDFEENISQTTQKTSLSQNLQQIQQKQNSNFSVGMSKGLQNLLKRNQETNSKSILKNNSQKNNLSQINTQDQNKNNTTLQTNKQNEISNSSLSQQQSTQNVQSESKSKMQSLMSMHSSKQNQQQIESQQPKEQQQQQNIFKQPVNNFQNKQNLSQISLNQNYQYSDDDDEEEMKQLFSQQNTNKIQPQNSKIISSKTQDINNFKNQNTFNSAQNQSNQISNSIYKTPVQTSKGSTQQNKIPKYTPVSENMENDDDSLYQNFENSYQNMMMGTRIQKGGNRLYGDESINLSKSNNKGINQNHTTAKKQTKKQIPQLTPYKLNLQLYQKKKQMKQSVDEYKLYNLTSQQFEVKLADYSIPKELKDYNIKQINRGIFNNKKIPRLTVIMIEFEILHQIIKATLLDFSGSLSGSFSKSIFMDDAGDNNQAIIKKEEEIDDDDDDLNDESDSDDFINRNYGMDIEGKENTTKKNSKKEKKKKQEKKVDFSTVYTMNHERGTQISLKLNTLLVLKDVTVIQQNEEPPFLNISEKNIIQVVFPF